MTFLFEDWRWRRQNNITCKLTYIGISRVMDRDMETALFVRAWGFGLAKMFFLGFRA